MQDNVTAGYTIASGGGGSGFAWDGKCSVPTGYALGSEFGLVNVALKTGTEQFVSPAGKTETGHGGDGHVRITRIEVIEL